MDALSQIGIKSSCLQFRKSVFTIQGSSLLNSSDFIICISLSSFFCSYWWQHNSVQHWKAGGTVLHVLPSDDKWILLMPWAKCLLPNATVCECFLLQNSSCSFRVRGFMDRKQSWISLLQMTQKFAPLYNLLYNASPSLFCIFHPHSSSAAEVTFAHCLLSSFCYLTLSCHLVCDDRNLSVTQKRCNGLKRASNFVFCVMSLCPPFSTFCFLIHLDHKDKNLVYLYTLISTVHSSHLGQN